MYTEEQIIDDLKNWKSLIKPYAKPEKKLARKNVINTFAPFVLLVVAAAFGYEYSIWLSLFLSVCAGLFLTRIFIIQHDCGHQSFFPDKKANDRTGFIMSLFTCIPYKYWARSHNHHHAHQGQLDTRTIGDVTLLTVAEFQELSQWGKIKYRLYRSFPVMFILGPLYYLFIHNRFPFITLKGWDKERKLLLHTNFYLLGFFLLLGVLMSIPSFDLLYGFKKLAIVYIPVLLTFVFTAIWFFYMQHQHNPNYKAWKQDWKYLLAAIKGSSYYKLPGIVNFFTGNIGFHHLHHLAPKIPFYKLKKCSVENPIFQKHVSVITFWSSLKYAFYTLWDEENGRMIRFSQLKKVKVPADNSRQSRMPVRKVV
ncbi:MAG: fatty acid desaturase [Chryseobacterium sp.]|nr:MAG: fatty acid desaturase [Chryseobacterium sp.]